MKNTGLALAAGLLLLAPGVGAQDEPAFVFGAYYRCNPAWEGQADEVVREVVGPVLQRHVDAGSLTGWLWLTHNQGGDWRRILATTGNDLGQMMQVRAEMVAELSEGVFELSRAKELSGAGEPVVCATRRPRAAAARA